MRAPRRQLANVYSPEAIERFRRRAAAEQAVTEREARFPELTAENAREAIEWQERRIQALLAD